MATFDFGNTGGVHVVANYNPNTLRVTSVDVNNTNSGTAWVRARDPISKQYYPSPEGAYVPAGSQRYALGNNAYILQAPVNGEWPNSPLFEVMYPAPATPPPPLP